MTGRDTQRVEALERYDVLEQPPRPELLAIVELAAMVCGTPMATINLITDVAQHQVAAYGFDASICRREDSMCAVVLDADTPTVVPDARHDPRFRDNPFVTGVIGSVRFYASHLLVTPDGIPIGTLCVFDEAPRELDDAQVHGLTVLAARIVDVLELSLRTRQLVASNDRLATFAGRVSHDLKSPLASVAMALDLLHEQLDDADERAWLVERAVRGADRMRALIDHALDFASLGGRAEFEQVDLERVLDDVLSDLATGLTGVTVSRSPLPTVLGDRVQLWALLQNLVDNAVKYQAPGRPLAIEVSAEQQGRVWRVAVADNGRGIPEEQHSRVFEPRVRLETDVRGHGIGLDTCRRVVEAHGGRIGVCDNAAGGATFWFELT